MQYNTAPISLAASSPLHRRFRESENPAGGTDGAQKKGRYRVATVRPERFQTRSPDGASRNPGPP